MLKLKLLTWDVKDTLLRLRFPVGESYAAKARAHGLQVKAEVLTQCFHQAYKAQSTRYPNYGLGKGLSSKQWWLDVVGETFRLSGGHEDRLLLPIATELYHDFSQAHNWELLPGASETLGQCRQRGIRMAVVSNFDRRLNEILAQCSLRQYFEFVLTSEDAGFAKPDKRIFMEALRISGVIPQLAAHVGDNYEKDYKAARAAGMHGFLLPTARQASEWETEIPKEHVLPSLSQLPFLIERG